VKEHSKSFDDTANLVHTASGGDYPSVNVSVTVDDDETAALVLSKSSINPGEGGNESYTVKPAARRSRGTAPGRRSPDDSGTPVKFLVPWLRRRAVGVSTLSFAVEAAVSADPPRSRGNP